MKSVYVTGPATNEWVEVDRRTPHIPQLRQGGDVQRGAFREYAPTL